MRLLTVILATSILPHAYADGTLQLSSLDLTKMTQGWGKPSTNLSVTGKPMSIAGAKFDSGVGTHGVSRLWLNLDGHVERFTALVGMDDSASGSGGSVAFQVIGNEQLLWESGVMKPGDAARSVSVPLQGVGTLLLLATDGGDGADHDHADWADARFAFNGDPPKPIDPPREAAVILTPSSPATPRINGARIFGVRPGSPLLFTIAASGERPMTFKAEQLPSGLELDPQTGQITGVIQKAGEYLVTLSAANRRGSARRELKIVCGNTLALTPHMGWNSWYIWENYVTDQIMRNAADAMVSSGLINHGYSYVNIDDCWANKPGSKDPMLDGPARDSQGKVLANKRFPDMKGLTDYIHAKGLKAGIYTSPGPTTCAGHVGAYQHEEQDVTRFVEWGFDFLKHDWCSYGSIAKSNSRDELQKPYRLIAEILKRQPRDVVLNLCQYGMGNVWEWGAAVGGHSWRTAGDLGQTYEGIAYSLFRDGFDVYAKHNLHQFGGPGGWNDPDYLLLGFLSNWKGQTAPTPLTPNEQYTHVSLWCLVAAPLIFSGDMTRLDEFTLNLLTNDEVIDIDQDPLGKPGRRVHKAGDLEVWSKTLEDGSRAVGLFNRGEFATRVTAKWSDIGVSGRHQVRDLWRQKNLGSFSDSFTAQTPRHGVVLVRVGGPQL